MPAQTALLQDRQSTTRPAEEAVLQLPVSAVLDAEVSVSVFNDIAAVERIWRGLEGAAIESPGQSYDFIKLWVEMRNIAPANQAYVVAFLDGVPVALLPLHRRRARGARIFSWFPGTNVGAYAPVMDLARVAALSAEARKKLWVQMTGALSGADLVYLRAMPDKIGDVGLFDDLGSARMFDTLYRSRYSNWAECDQLQRSKSRRKHDRQQGERLDAMGDVSFAEVRGGLEARAIIKTMFEQRTARFKAQGIPDTFARNRLVGFYQAMGQGNTGVDVRLHVLRLNGEIVAVRYNIVHGNRMFCLISSMSEDPAIQNGSPGKQCLLRVMQGVFEQGYVVFDMGAGLTDEKRHWCNERIVLSQHYVPLNWRGRIIAGAHQQLQRTRVWLKANKGLISAIRTPGQWFNKAVRAPRADAELD